jgi:hypothetical protein
MDEPFESVYESTVVYQVEMLAEVLVRNGIGVRVIGGHAELFAAAPHVAPQRIEVPASRAAEARELIEALEAERTEEDASATEV